MGDEFPIGERFIQKHADVTQAKSSEPTQKRVAPGSLANRVMNAATPGINAPPLQGKPLSNLALSQAPMVASELLTFKNEMLSKIKAGTTLAFDPLRNIQERQVKNIAELIHNASNSVALKNLLNNFILHDTVKNNFVVTVDPTTSHKHRDAIHHIQQMHKEKHPNTPEPTIFVLNGNQLDELVTFVSNQLQQQAQKLKERPEGHRAKMSQNATKPRPPERQGDRSDEAATSGASTSTSRATAPKNTTSKDPAKKLLARIKKKEALEKENSQVADKKGRVEQFRKREDTVG
jgi:hypothetical protein